MLLLALALLVCPSNVSAQLARLGGQFQINSSTVRESYILDVAALPDLIGPRFTFRGPAGCPGDCNYDGEVTVDELILAVKAALEPDTAPMRRCLAADTDLDYRVSIHELVAAVARAVDSCDR